MIIIDTSVLVRFFTKDDLIRAIKAKEILESGDQLFVPDVDFVELQFVLQKIYKIDRMELGKCFTFLISRGNMETSQEAKQAVQIFLSTTLGIVDCFLISFAQGGILASFDNNLIKASMVKSYWSS